MTPRRINLTALLRDYRAACYANGINPSTGNPARCDNPHWWADPALWQEVGPNHSATEAAALASIAAQARAAVTKPEPAGYDEILPVQFRNMVEEVAAEPGALHDMLLREFHWNEDRPIILDPHEVPLRVLHELRGVEVDEVAGVRMEVPIRNAERRKGKRWQKWYDYLRDSGMLREEDENAA